MLPEKRINKNEKDLNKARLLSNKITRKMKTAGFTQKEIEKDVHEVYREIKQNRSSNRY
ncbi:hypothetical protein IT084_05325 [Desulfallas sp. Bu1-1]|uniref:hypothetical protein n=1 Tax=Desulfallas sp. Bu1-1 TaxID=2787620 RepID=UPI00189F6058|nr:hypothetical protein [Desulfallas sp. Bu1-1]MBF7082399.1 hypothetical protein [Desulfallas sp. Bu1-1]